jgi:hypothetical protein
MICFPEEGVDSVLEGSKIVVSCFGVRQNGE